MNDLLTNIPTNDITELNDLIYAGAKLVSEKTRVGTQTRITDKKKNLRQQVKMLKRNKKIYSDETEKELQLEWKI